MASSSDVGVEIREDGVVSDRAATSDKAGAEAEIDFSELQAEEDKGLTACADETTRAGNDWKDSSVFFFSAASLIDFRG